MNAKRNASAKKKRIKKQALTSLQRRSRRRGTSFPSHALTMSSVGGWSDAKSRRTPHAAAKAPSSVGAVSKEVARASMLAFTLLSMVAVVSVGDRGEYSSPAPWLRDEESDAPSPRLPLMLPLLAASISLVPSASAGVEGDA